MSNKKESTIEVPIELFESLMDWARSFYQAVNESERGVFNRENHPDWGSVEDLAGFAFQDHEKAKWLLEAHKIESGGYAWVYENRFILGQGYVRQKPVLLPIEQARKRAQYQNVHMEPATINQCFEKSISDPNK